MGKQPIQTLSQLIDDLTAAGIKVTDITGQGTGIGIIGGVKKTGKKKEKKKNESATGTVQGS